MDPQETLNELLSAISDYHNYEYSVGSAMTIKRAQDSLREDIIIYLQDLSEWLNKGGVMPKIES